MENKIMDFAIAVRDGYMELGDVPKPYQKEVGELVEKLRAGQEKSASGESE